MNQTFTYEEALEASKLYFNGEELPAKVFVDKYALRNNKGELLECDPNDMHNRIASEIARIEKKKFAKPLSKEEIFDYLKNFGRIVPQGSPMYGIGNPYQYVTISNCYVTKLIDSYGGIHRTDEHISQISKRRGGIGFDISALRPDGATTHNSSRTSTGIIPFMERFSNSIREVGQNGRRGAMMLTISIHHPQVLDFATVKKDLTKVTGANISIRLSDEFLKAVDDDTEYEQRWPVDAKKPKISKMVRARDVWKVIIDGAWSVAEPGLLFWDTILRESPADCYAEHGFRSISTNPCSEISISELDSCRLLLLNLYSYVNHPYTSNATFDYVRFYEDAKIAQRIMDDIVDLEMECVQRILDKLEKDPEEDNIKFVEKELWQKVYSACELGRRTGTGVTALGDTLAALGVGYGTDESIQVAEKIYQTLKFGCYQSSIDMSKELGSFPVWNKDLEKNNPFLKRFCNETVKLSDEITLDGKKLYQEMQEHGRRNIAILTTAPAGTVSILTQTTSGIEPAFMLEYLRRKKVNPSDKNARIDFVDQSGDSWEEFIVYHPKVRDWMKITGETDIKKSPWYGYCAEEIDWQQRVKLQAAAQKHIDHSISSTINLPENISVEKVAEIYETAWKSGCKGITVYRSNCRSGVLVDNKKIEDINIPKTDSIKRPKEIPCDLHHITVKGEPYLVVVGLVNSDPYEVMVTRGKFPKKYANGISRKVKRGQYEVIVGDSDEVKIQVTSDCDEHEEALTRMTSTALRHGADINFVVHQLEKSKGDIQSFSKSIARALKKYISDGQKVSGESCSSCGSESIVRQEGCVTCKNCGWSKC